MKLFVCWLTINFLVHYSLQWLEFCLFSRFQKSLWVKLLPSHNICNIRASKACWKISFVFSAANFSKFAKILNCCFNILEGQRYLEYPLHLWLKFKAQHNVNRPSEETKHPAYSAASAPGKFLFCCAVLIIPFATTTRKRRERSNRELMNKNQIKDLIFLWEGPEERFGCLHWTLRISVINTNRIS